MNVDDAIRATRATRAFADQTVTKSQIEELVDAARRAGSGHNRQPWRFVAAVDGEWTDELATFGEYTTPLERAPAGIALGVMEADSDRRAEHNVFDCGRAAQNLSLAATVRGLGICPQGLSDREGAAKFLGFPEGYLPLMAFAVGVPAEEPARDIEGVPKEEELHHPGREPVGEVLEWAGDPE